MKDSDLYEKLVSQCAQAICDLDRITPSPLTPEDQARAVLAMVFYQRIKPSKCDHSAGFYQFEGDTFCRTCDKAEEFCKPNKQKV